MIKDQCQTVQWVTVSTKWPPIHGTMCKILSFLWPCKNVKERSKQQILCTTSSSKLTVETMIKDQCQTVQWVTVSTKWPPIHGTMCKILSFLWPCKNVKERSKQQILCATSSSQLTVETMIEGESQTVQSDPRSWYNVQKILSFCDLAKKPRKGQGQNNRSCAKLHHPS